MFRNGISRLCIIAIRVWPYYPNFILAESGDYCRIVAEWIMNTKHPCPLCRRPCKGFLCITCYQEKREERKVVHYPTGRCFNCGMMQTYKLGHWRVRARPTERRVSLMLCFVCADKRIRLGIFENGQKELMYI